MLTWAKLNFKNMPIMNKLTASYLAGFIDGEGYIGIMRRKRPWGCHYMPVLKVTNTNQEIIKWLKDSYGGVTEVRKFAGNPKDAYSWRLAGNNLKRFLMAILPYLRIKKEQAKIVMKRIKLYREIGKTDERTNGWNLKYSEESKMKIINLYWQIRQLNQRGKVLAR